MLRRSDLLSPVRKEHPGSRVQGGVGQEEAHQFRISVVQPADQVQYPRMDIR